MILSRVGCKISIMDLLVAIMIAFSGFALISLCVQNYYFCVGLERPCQEANNYLSSAKFHQLIIYCFNLIHNFELFFKANHSVSVHLGNMFL